MSQVPEPGWRYAVSEPAPRDGKPFRVAWFESSANPRVEGWPVRWQASGARWESWSPIDGVWQEERNLVIEYWKAMTPGVLAEWGLGEEQT